MITNKFSIIKHKIWKKIIGSTKETIFYPLFYRSYWYYFFVGDKRKLNIKNYYTVYPNIGAGIGHQLANWNAGFWFSEMFKLNHLHTPFSNNDWENFLGLGENEINEDYLVSKGYNKVFLPLFDENDASQVNLQKAIIKSYSSKKVIFIAEIDQFYRDQYGVLKQLQKKFYNSNYRLNDKLPFDDNAFNLAIHVRRGDIVASQNKNHTMRWLDNDYFTNILDQVLKKVQKEKNVQIYLFSQGKEEEFKEFNQFENLHFCLDMSAKDSFLTMVYADVLITSKSSFSYKPALLNKGIKVCPENFWHGYPVGDDWWMVDDKGNLKEQIK